MLSKFSVLLAEDEEVTRENLAQGLALLVGDVYTAEDGQQAYEMYLEKNPDIIIADIEMPHMTGLQLAAKKYAKKIKPHRSS